MLAVVALACTLDVGTGHWETRAPMGVPRQEIGAAAIGGTLYAVAGFDARGPTAAAT